MSQVEIVAVALDAHAREYDDLAVRNGRRARVARSRSQRRIEAQDSAHGRSLG
jgi:hypothetical protein